MGQALLKVLFSDVTNYWSRYLDIFLDVKIWCLLISSRRGWFPFSYTRVISEADGSSMRQLRVHKYVFGGFYFELKIKATSLNINRLNVGFTCVFPASTGRAAAQATFWREKTWLSPPLTTACTPVWRRRVLLRCIADNSAPTAWQCQASHRWGGLKNHTQTHTHTHTGFFPHMISQVTHELSRQTKPGKDLCSSVSESLDVAPLHMLLTWDTVQG